MGGTQAGGARLAARGDWDRRVGEDDAVAAVGRRAPPCERAPSGGTIEPPVYPAKPVTSEDAGSGAVAGLPACAPKAVDLGPHGSPLAPRRGPI